jgi:long-chain acyl-CoA synthetase
MDGEYRERARRFARHHSALCDGATLIYAGTLLARAAQRWPHKTALIAGPESISYESLFDRAAAVSELLKKEGVVPGERVLLIWENSIEFYVAYYGIWQTGAVVAPLNIFLHPHELAHIIEDAEPRAIIASPKQQEKLKQLTITVPTCIDPQTILSAYRPKKLVTPTTQQGNLLAALLYTSGTTGLPKGVMLSSDAILTNVAQGLSVFEQEENERAYAALPLFHSFMQSCVVWGAVAVGATVIIVPQLERRAIKEGFAQRPTAVFGVPGLFGLFALMKTIPFDSVKYIICGGDALPEKIRMGFELVYGRKLCNGYGLTEAAPFVSIDIDETAQPLNGVGRPMVGMDIEIRAESGAALPQGEIGELCIRGNNLMMGYYNAPEATASTIVDGWLLTGDLAREAEDGSIIICGRRKDLIVHKGINIYPQEIENILMLHPLVMYAAVVGKPDELVGEIPVAFVATRTSSDTLKEDLETLCKTHCAPYKIPRAFFIERELPLTSTGKVDKKILRKKL